MKNYYCFIIGFIMSQSIGAQINGSRVDFDYSTLDQKILYIQEYGLGEEYIKNMIKRGYQYELKEKEDELNSLNEAWEEALNTSSYNATPYEIRGYDLEKLYLEMNEKALILEFEDGFFHNYYYRIISTGPRKVIIASILINEIDLKTASGIRLIMNLLNDELMKSAEVYEENGKFNTRKLKEKYQLSMSKNVEDIGDMTFLVPNPGYRNDSKNLEKKKELQQAFEDNWTISKYKMISQEEFDLVKRNGESDMYYWLAIPEYFPFFTSSYKNYLMTTDGDKIIFEINGHKKLKPKTLIKLQLKISEHQEK